MSPRLNFYLLFILRQYVTRVICRMVMRQIPCGRYFSLLISEISVSIVLFMSLTQAYIIIIECRILFYTFIVIQIIYEYLLSILRNHLAYMSLRLLSY